MKRFECSCGERIYFENTLCLSCRATLGFDPNTLQMVALDQYGADDSGYFFRVCKNSLDFGVCNWLLPAEGSEYYCLSCQLNRTIPQLTAGDNLNRWRKLETAKRRLLYTLLELGLPVSSQTRSWPGGLAFDFIEDQRSNPTVPDQFVNTGHLNGVITINVAEADELYRMQMRQMLGELHRTVLGHFRHESGHYYFNFLINAKNMEAFRDRFGDESTNYSLALDTYYSNSRGPDWTPNFISRYASSHPFEDWAETWAHYLMVTDTLDTASAEGLLRPAGVFDEAIDQWTDMTVQINQVARSMGLDDPYPFTINDVVRSKLCFVDDVIRGRAEHMHSRSHGSNEVQVQRGLD